MQPGVLGGVQRDSLDENCGLQAAAERVLHIWNGCLAEAGPPGDTSIFHSIFQSFGLLLAGKSSLWPAAGSSDINDA